MDEDDLKWVKNKRKLPCSSKQVSWKFRSTTLGCRKIKSVFRDLKWCFNASRGVKGLTSWQCICWLSPFIIVFFSWIFDKREGIDVVKPSLFTVFAAGSGSRMNGMRLKKTACPIWSTPPSPPSRRRASGHGSIFVPANQWWFNTEPESKTPGQHWASIGSAPHVCLETGRSHRAVDSATLWRNGSWAPKLVLSGESAFFDAGVGWERSPTQVPKNVHIILTT